MNLWRTGDADSSYTTSKGEIGELQTCCTDLFPNLPKPLSAVQVMNAYS